MKLNADKCHLLVLGQRCDDPVTVRIGSANVVNSYEEKLLGVQIDSKLSFDNHVSKLCQKASNKLYALARISPYMDQRKLRTLMRGEGIYYQSISILSFNLDVSRQAAQQKN